MLRFDVLLDIVGQGAEEVETGDGLDVVDGGDGRLSAAVELVVGHQEGNAHGGIGIWRYYDLEKAFGYWNARLADGVGKYVAEHRAGYDV